MENQLLHNLDIRKKLYMPVVHYVQEAFTLHWWCSHDSSQLTKAGMDVTLIDQLYEYAVMLQKAEARWQEIKRTKKRISRDIKKAVIQLHEIHTSFLHYFRFAFKNDPRQSAVLKKMMKKITYPAIAQRVHNFIIMGKEFPGKLEAIGFNVKKMKEAENFLLHFKALYAKKNENNESDTYKKIKKARDHAALQLKEIVDIIRKYGQFVFWRNPERKRGYRSDYIHKRNKQNYKARKAKTA